MHTDLGTGAHTLSILVSKLKTTWLCQVHPRLIEPQPQNCNFSILQYYSCVICAQLIAPTATWKKKTESTITDSKSLPSTRLWCGWTRIRFGTSSKGFIFPIYEERVSHERKNYVLYSPHVNKQYLKAWVCTTPIEYFAFSRTDRVAVDDK